MLHYLNIRLGYNFLCKLKNTEPAELLMTITSKSKWIILIRHQNLMENLLSDALLIKEEIKYHLVMILPDHSFLIEVNSSVSSKVIDNLHEVFLIISVVNKKRGIDVTSMETFNHLSCWIGKFFRPSEWFSQERVKYVLVCSIIKFSNLFQCFIPIIHQKSRSLTIRETKIIKNLILVIPANSSWELILNSIDISFFKLLELLLKQQHVVS